MLNILQKKDNAGNNSLNRRDRAAVVQTMDQCTKCGICLSYCPVAAVTGEFPGPKYAGPQAQRFRVIEQINEVSPTLCSGCGVCTSVCPNNVEIADIITLAKADNIGFGRHVSLGQKLLNRPELIGRFAGMMPWVSNLLLRNSLARKVIEVVLGIHSKAPLPTIHGSKFARWFSTHKQPDGPLISYFTGCAINNYDPAVGIAMVKVLNRLGYRVDIPTDLCCSLPMLSSGDFISAAPRARSVVEALGSVAIDVGKIISTSTSCSLTLRSKYAAYLDMTDEVSNAVAIATVDACEFLLENHIDTLQRELTPLHAKILYHGPCQLRGHFMGQPAVELLRLIPGIEIEMSQADCCGIGGTYGFDKDKFEISSSIGKTLFDQVRKFQPELIVCDSETCRWNIEKQTFINTVHPIQLLSWALGLDGTFYQDKL